MTEASGAESQECYDVLGRTIRTVTRGFDGTWDAQDTEYDAVGQVRRKSEPFLLASANQVAPHWTTLSYPDNSVSTTAYNGLATTVTNDKGQTRTELRDAAGEIVHPNAPRCTT